MPIQIDVPGQGIVEFPDGMTDQQIEAAIQANQTTSQPSYSQQLLNVAKNPLAATGSALGGIGEAGLQLGTGLGASAIGGLQGLYGLATGDTGEQAAQTVQGTQEALTYQPRTPQGQVASQVLAAPIEYGSKAAGYVGGQVGGMLGGEQGRIAGESIGETSVPIAATLFGGAGALRGARGATVAGTAEQLGLTNIPVVSGAVRGVRDVIRSKSEAGKVKMAQEYLQSLTTPEEASKVVSALRQRGGEVVPGSPVTSAEAIARANRQLELLGRPERFGSQFVTLQEGLAKVPETSADLTTIKLLQEKARADVLNKGAGSDLAYKAAEELRSKNAAKGYGDAGKFVLETDKALNLLMTRPSMPKALKRASEIAQEQNKPFQIGKDIPEQTIASPLLDASGKPVSQITIPAQYAKFPVQSLQYVKMALDDMIATPKDYGIGASELKFIGETKSQLTKWIQDRAPLYEKANTQYAIDSLPIQQMDLWRALKEKFITPSGKEVPGSYLKALKDQTKLIKEATGFKRGSEISDIFNKEQSSLAAKLAAEMEMELVKNRMAKEVTLPGIGKAAEGLEPKLPNMLMRETMIANFLLKHLAENANVGVNIAASRILQDPKMLASTLKQVKPAHRTQVLKVIKDAAINRGSVAGAMAVQPQAQQKPLEINIYGGQQQ